MWEFMSKYADSFWQTGEYAYQVFRVVLAWGLTLGLTCIAFYILVAVGEMIRDSIRDHYKEDKENGKK